MGEKKNTHSNSSKFFLIWFSYFPSLRETFPFFFSHFLPSPFLSPQITIVTVPVYWNSMKFVNIFSILDKDTCWLIINFLILNVIRKKKKENVGPNLSQEIGPFFCEQINPVATQLGATQRANPWTS